MGCGANAGALHFDKKISVNGDAFNTDTRNLLTILDIGEIQYKFQSSDEEMSAGGIPEMAKHSPVIEDTGRKIMGSQKELLLYASYLDRRNAPKLNAKGKPIKKKKTDPVAKSLVPESLDKQEEMERLFDWFLMKFRPHCQHLFRQILMSLQFETVKGLNMNKAMAEQREENAQLVFDDMDFIHQSLKLLNK